MTRRIPSPRSRASHATKREFIAFGAAAALTSAGIARSPDVGPRGVTPEMFGAKGDGRTNDTAAFEALSAHVNANGGGTVVLRPVTYIVGLQRPSTRAGLSFEGSVIINLTGCTAPISIRGNGAKLRAAPGLRYGRFDRQSGRPLPDSAKLDQTNQAVPFTAMINIENCSADVQIADIELDGNLETMLVGGRSFPNGWEAFGYGIRLVGNKASERLARVRSHHLPLDGLLLIAALERRGSTSVTDVVCDYNGRQGCTIGGGSNFSFDHCRFNHTGRAGFGASPGAGVDIESGKDPIRHVTFANCEFSDNLGFGLVAGSGDSADISCTSCRFIGTTNYAAWPDMPRMRFKNCLFVGSINHAHADSDPAAAAQFENCTFSDDPSLTPTGKVFLSVGKWIAIVLQGPNVLFSHCRFRLVGDGVLPLSDNRVIYANCIMSQRSSRPSGPRGIYIGTTTISGNAYLEKSSIRGTVIFNGRMLPRQK
jgi:hypothetical protein